VSTVELAADHFGPGLTSIDPLLMKICEKNEFYIFVPDHICWSYTDPRPCVWPYRPSRQPVDSILQAQLPFLYCGLGLAMLTSLITTNEPLVGQSSLLNVVVYVAACMICGQ